MDRNVSTPVKSKLFGTTWQSDVANLIEVKNKFLGVKNIELFLPYIAYRTYEDSNLEFIYINEKKQHNILKDTHLMFYMTLFLREGYNKQTLGIELTTDAKIIPQLYNRKREYYYRWNTNELTIRKVLGTYDVNKIEKMIQSLLNEYKRFYMMYCKIN